MLELTPQSQKTGVRITNFELNRVYSNTQHNNFPHLPTPGSRRWLLIVYWLSCDYGYSRLCILSIQCLLVILISVLFDRGDSAGVYPETEAVIGRGHFSRPGWGGGPGRWVHASFTTNSSISSKDSVTPQNSALSTDVYCRRVIIRCYTAYYTNYIEYLL